MTATLPRDCHFILAVCGIPVLTASHCHSLKSGKWQSKKPGWWDTSPLYIPSETLPPPSIGATP